MHVPPPSPHSKPAQQVPCIAHVRLLVCLIAGFARCRLQPGRGRRSNILPHMQQQQAVSWAAARRRNSCSRDFTVNALLYDPFQAVLFDYVGGMADARQRLLRCVGDPGQRFSADPACLLRAVRCAARAGEDDGLEHGSVPGFVGVWLCYHVVQGYCTLLLRGWMDTHRDAQSKSKTEEQDHVSALPTNVLVRKQCLAAFLVCCPKLSHPSGLPHTLS